MMDDYENLKEIAREIWESGYNETLMFILQSIQEKCGKRKCCEGCLCAGTYKGVEGRTRYYCALEEIPEKWQTGIIRDNIDDMKEENENGNN